MLPLMVSFPDNSVNIFQEDKKLVRFLFDLPFIIEIFLNFNLSYFEHGERIISKKQIVARYLHWRFGWDLTELILTAVIVTSTHKTFSLILFILRFVKFKDMYDAIEEKFQLSLRFAVSYTLLNLSFSLFIVAHVCGCIFHLIAMNLEK